MEAKSLDDSNPKIHSKRDFALLKKKKKKERKFLRCVHVLAGVFLKLLIPVIQTFCYHGNVTLHFSLFSQARHVSGVAS